MTSADTPKCKPPAKKQKKVSKKPAPAPSTTFIEEARKAIADRFALTKDEASVIFLWGKEKEASFRINWWDTKQSYGQKIVRSSFVHVNQELHVSIQE
jgi:hypothetical protein